LTAKPYPARLARERPPYRPGAAKVAVDRDVHQRYHDREIEQLRKKVWQPASREDEIPEVGDYVLYDVGPLSFIVVRTGEAPPDHFLKELSQDPLLARVRRYSVSRSWPAALAGALCFPRVDGVIPAQQGHHLGDLGGPFLGRLCLLHAVQDRKAIGRIQCVEQFARRGFGVERGVQVSIRRRFTLAGVGRRPSPIRLGLVDLRPPPRAHAARFLQSLAPLTIDL
jgi:hypothetical protein